MKCISQEVYWWVRVFSFCPPGGALAEVRRIPTSKDAFALRISGEITSADVDSFSVILRSVDRARHAVLGVSLNSNGGDIYAAIEIGRRLRGVRGAAVVNLNDECVSACVFVLAGAVTRSVEGRIGIHRPYSVERKELTFGEQQKAHDNLNNVVRSYLKEMNIHEGLLDAMNTVPPERIRYLSPDDIQSFGLGDIDPVEGELQDSSMAARIGISKQEYLRRKALAEDVCEPLIQGENADFRFFSEYYNCRKRILGLP